MYMVVNARARNMILMREDNGSVAHLLCKQCLQRSIAQILTGEETGYTLCHNNKTFVTLLPSLHNPSHDECAFVETHKETGEIEALLSWAFLRAIQPQDNNKGPSHS